MTETEKQLEVLNDLIKDALENKETVVQEEVNEIFMSPTSEIKDSYSEGSKALGRVRKALRIDPVDIMESKYFIDFHREFGSIVQAACRSRMED